MPQLEIHRKLLNLTNLTLGSLIFSNPTLAQSASFVTDITKDTYLLSPIIVTEITDLPIHYRKPFQITIKKIEIIGNTVFSTEELRKLVASYEGQKLSFEQMLEISQIITEYYTSRGYIRSGAFVPPQELVNGIVKVQVIEGKLEEILIQGLKQTKESYVRARLEPRLTTPIQRKNLESALELLQIDPLFEKVEAELKPGSSPDKSILVVKISEALPGTITLAADNYSSPSVGENQGTAALSYQNLLGIGDRFKFEYNGGAGLSRYKAGYSIPVNRNDGVLSIDYAHSDTEIVEDPFTVLDIQANSNVFSLNFRQPVLKTAKEELALSLGVELKESQTYLFKEIPFSFAEGAENGKSRETILRLAQDWVKRSETRVLAARSQFSFGLNAFDATSNSDAPDGQFFSWIGQFYWLEKLDKNLLFVTRWGMQISSDALLSIEQFDIGGKDTVRGYRQSVLLGDNGFVGTIELQWTVWDDWGQLNLISFADVGTVWGDLVTSENTLASVGLGLRWSIGERFLAELNWGFPLVEIEGQGDSLQEKGASFQVLWQAVKF